MLILPIKKKWFEMIISGEKTVEYREPKVYWMKRLLRERIVQNVSMNYSGLKVRIRNGYAKNAESAILTLSEIDQGQGLKEWGAEEGKEYLRLHILRVDAEPEK